MFTTVDETKKYTGQDVTNDQIFMAQSLIEAFIGRIEAQVDDATDKENLAKATAYQAVYMKDNADTVFSQVDVQSVANFGSTITFRNDASPFVSSLARFALRNLSWRGTRTVRLGKTIQPRRYPSWVRD